MTLQPTGTQNSPARQALTTIQKLEALSKVNIFKAMGPHELLVLANRAIVQDYAAGEQIYQAGEMAQHIYCLIGGRVALRREDQAQRILPGGTFGTLSRILPSVFLIP